MTVSFNQILNIFVSIAFDNNINPQSKAFYVRNTMILNSFLRGLHSDRKLDFKCILLTSDRRQRFKDIWTAVETDICRYNFGNITLHMYVSTE